MTPRSQQRNPEFLPCRHKTMRKRRLANNGPISLQTKDRVLTISRARWRRRRHPPRKTNRERSVPPTRKMKPPSFLLRGDANSEITRFFFFSQTAIETPWKTSESLSNQKKKKTKTSEDLYPPPPPKKKTPETHSKKRTHNSSPWTTTLDRYEFFFFHRALRHSLRYNDYACCYESTQGLTPATAEHLLPTTTRIHVLPTLQ